MKCICQIWGLDTPQAYGSIHLGKGRGSVSVGMRAVRPRWTDKMGGR